MQRHDFVSAALPLCSPGDDDLGLGELSLHRAFLEIVRLVASEAVASFPTIGARLSGLEYTVRCASGSDGEPHQSPMDELPISNAPEHSSIVLPAHESWSADQRDRWPRSGSGLEAMVVVRQQMSNF